MDCRLTQKIRISTFCVLKINLPPEIKGCGQEVFSLPSPWEAWLLDNQGPRLPLESRMQLYQLQLQLLEMRVMELSRNIIAKKDFRRFSWLYVMSLTLSGGKGRKLFYRMPWFSGLLISPTPRLETLTLASILLVSRSLLSLPTTIVISSPETDLKLDISFLFCPF